MRPALRIDGVTDNLFARVNSGRRDRPRWIAVRKCRAGKSGNIGQQGHQHAESGERKFDNTSSFQIPHSTNPYRDQKKYNIISEKLESGEQIKDRKSVV